MNKNNFANWWLILAAMLFVLPLARCESDAPATVNEPDTSVELPDVPDKPAAVYVVAGDGELLVNWLASLGATSYTVKRSEVNGGPYTDVASNITELSYLNTGITNGITYYYVVTASNLGGTSEISMQGRATAVVPLEAKWPLSQSTSDDEDGIRFQYGPRNIGRYDFHAGIDIPAEIGTPIYPVAEGVVEEVLPWNGTSSSGNKVVIKHGTNQWTQYLHMDSIADNLQVNDLVSTMSQIGTVGKTGASLPHLHFTYVVASSAASAGESRSKNPLEIFPHSAPQNLIAVFRTDLSNAVDVVLQSHQMTVRWVILQGADQTRMVDYYEVVSQGSADRDTQTQAGLYFEVSAPTQANPAAKVPFTLTVRPEPFDAYDVMRIILIDFKGSVLLDMSDTDFDNYADPIDNFPKDPTQW